MNMSSTLSTRRRGRSTIKSAAEITTFPNAVKYLLERTDVERMRVIRTDHELFKLDRVRALLDLLGNPQEQIKTVHVAGSLGKGSTVAMIASMMQGCGYAVGQYTSPHLVDVRERISINGQPITKAEFTEAMRQVATEAEKLTEEPTFFELVTALAFKQFAEQAVDIAIIETGLGGRLDATNVIKPEVSVITLIDYDHMHILGRTLPEIAREKAGIFKSEVLALSTEQPAEVEEVLRDEAAKINTTFRMINKDIEYSSRFGAAESLGPHTRICVITGNSQFMHLPVPLPGEHQALNCALALSTIDALKNSGFEFPEVALYAGLAATNVPGRMEIAWEQPRILLDGAHNPGAIGALMRCVGAYTPYDSMICVFGCCEDKDIPAMLEKLALGADKIIFTRAKNTPRAADPDELQKAFEERSGKMSQVASTLGEALTIASRAVGRDDLICVTGSFYLVGEAKKFLADLERKRKK